MYHSIKKNSRTGDDISDGVLENHPVEVVLLRDVGLDERVTGVIVLKLRQVPVADLKDI